MLEKTKGVVLYTTAYNDKLSVVHIYTELFGRTAYAVSLSSSRRSARLRTFFSPFSVLEMEVEHKPGRELQRIREVQPLLVFQHLPYDEAKRSLVLFLSEFLARTIREPEANLPFFDFLVHSIQILDYLEEGKANFHLCFLIQYSNFLGFYPNVEGYQEGDYFDMMNGIFTSSLPGHGYFLYPEEARYFALLMRMNYQNLHLFKLSRTERWQILERVITYFRLHHPGLGTLRSLDVLRSLFD